MKKYFILFVTALFAFNACNEFDDTQIQEKLANLEARIEALEALQAQVNDLSTLVTALQNKDYVTGITPIMENGVQVGYSIMFTQSNAIEIRHGKDGKDGNNGKDGAAGSVVSMKKDADGVFYWTIDGQFTNPKMRVDAIKPEFKIDEEGYLCVSYDGKQTWERLGKTSATVEVDYELTYDEDYVYIKFLTDNVTVTLKREKEFTLTIAQTRYSLDPGSTVSVPYVLTNVDESVYVKIDRVDEDFAAVLNVTNETTGTVDVTLPNPHKNGRVYVKAVKVLENGNEVTRTRVLYFEEGKIIMNTPEYAAEADGGKLKVDFKTNMTDCVVEIPASAGWISYVDTKGFAEDYVYLYLLPNAVEERTGIVTFKDKYDNALATYTITQAADPATKIRALFGFQPTVENPRGFTNGANRTMAIVGDYLILSNSSDFTNMPVYHRMTGDYLPDVKINTTGIDAGRSIMAITNDDAGHLFAVAFTNTADEPTTNDSVRGWIWLNGIDQAPKSFMWADLKGAKYANNPYGVNGATKIDIYRTVRVRGDLAGDAIIATCSKGVPRPVFEFVVGGKLVGNAYVEWPSGGHPVSMWNSTAVVPFTGIATEGATPEERVANTKAQLEYVWSSGNYRKALVYSKAKTGVWFNLPTSHWWGTSKDDYGQVTWGVDVIEANGTRLMAVQNGNTAGGGQFYVRLYVSKLGLETPTADTFKNGFMFDSREGDATGDESKGGPIGSGFAITGLTSPHAFVTGTTVLGTNGNETGDVKFALGPDGKSVQVYMLTTNQGLLGYHIPFSKF